MNEVLAPHRRLPNAIDTPLLRGDLVEILVGPATGKLGLVVVERNANYADYEPYCSEESIGVTVVEDIPVDPVLGGIIRQITSDPTPFTRMVVRWFDAPDQLRLIIRPESD